MFNASLISSLRISGKNLSAPILQGTACLRGSPPMMLYTAYTHNGQQYAKRLMTWLFRTRTALPVAAFPKYGMSPRGTILAEANCKFAIPTLCQTLPMRESSLGFHSTGQSRRNFVTIRAVQEYETRPASRRWELKSPGQQGEEGLLGLNYIH